MVRRSGDRRIVENVNMRGGNGTVTISHALEQDGGEMLGKGRLFATLTLPAGASIGTHTHEGEMEAFAIISGFGRFCDNGLNVDVAAGDVAYTAPGESHSIENIGDCDLVMSAVIMFQ